eukprot:1405334-Amphidinium_carterae.1
MTRTVQCSDWVSPWNSQVPEPPRELEENAKPLTGCLLVAAVIRDRSHSTHTRKYESEKNDPFYASMFSLQTSAIVMLSALCSCPKVGVPVEDALDA